jgi:hypothetical protein
MVRLERVAAIENEVEAMCLAGELQQRDIPHLMRSYHDSAYDGLFQYGGGWGHVEAPAQYADEVRHILAELREGALTRTDQSAEPHDENDRE